MHTFNDRLVYWNIFAIFNPSLLVFVAIAKRKKIPRQTNTSNCGGPMNIIVANSEILLSWLCTAFSVPVAWSLESDPLGAALTVVLNLTRSESIAVGLYVTWPLGGGTSPIFASASSLASLASCSLTAFWSFCSRSFSSQALASLLLSVFFLASSTSVRIRWASASCLASCASSSKRRASPLQRLGSSFLQQLLLLKLLFEFGPSSFSRSWAHNRHISMTGLRQWSCELLRSEVSAWLSACSSCSSGSSSSVGTICNSSNHFFNSFTSQLSSKNSQNEYSHCVDLVS